MISYFNFLKSWWTSTNEARAPTQLVQKSGISLDSLETNKSYLRPPFPLQLRERWWRWLGGRKRKAGRLLLLLPSTNPTEERGRIGSRSLRRGSNLLFTRGNKRARAPQVAQHTYLVTLHSLRPCCAGDGGAQMLHASPAPPSHAPYVMSTSSVLAPLVAMGRRDAFQRPMWTAWLIVMIAQLSWWVIDEASATLLPDQWY